MQNEAHSWHCSKHAVPTKPTHFYETDLWIQSHYLTKRAKQINKINIIELHWISDLSDWPASPAKQESHDYHPKTFEGGFFRVSLKSSEVTTSMIFLLAFFVNVELFFLFGNTSIATFPPSSAESSSQLKMVCRLRFFATLSRAFVEHFPLGKKLPMDIVRFQEDSNRFVSPFETSSGYLPCYVFLSCWFTRFHGFICHSPTTNLMKLCFQSWCGWLSVSLHEDHVRRNPLYHT